MPRALLEPPRRFVRIASRGPSMEEVRDCLVICTLEHNVNQFLVVLGVNQFDGHARRSGIEVAETDF